MKIRWFLTLCFVLGAPLFADEPSWQDQLVQLDKQIQALSQQIDGYRHKSLTAESEAQNQMQSNFPLYIKDIKESEKYEALSRNAEMQMKSLMKERDELIKAHANESTVGQDSK